LSKLNRVLLIIVIILAIVTAILWFFPDVLSSLSGLNPFGGGQNTTSTTISSSNVSETRTNTASTPGDATNVAESNSLEENEQELSPFEEEIRQRHESYQTKVYTYEPYEPPVTRNPFERMVSSVYLEEEEEKVADELATEEDVRRFVQPELPPGSKFTGLISSGEEKLAILEIDEETYIVKEGDLILDKFLAKTIEDEKVVIDINGYEISLQLGGGEATND
jgi:Tfp pilus assembly protein PilP